MEPINHVTVIAPMIFIHTGIDAVPVFWGSIAIAVGTVPIARISDDYDS